MDVLEFIAARLDEDESAAKAATPGRWVVGGLPGAEYLPCDFIHAPDYRPEGFSDGQHVGDASVADGGMGPWAVSVKGSGFPRGNAAHIARWDPACVLAEIATKRAIADAHRRGRHSECVICDTGAQSCGYASWGDHPCDTLKLLASPDANHPDFSPAWTVEG